jgi:hypothetical protein
MTTKPSFFFAFMYETYGAFEAAAYTVTPAYKTAKTDAADAISNRAFVFLHKSDARSSAATAAQPTAGTVPASENDAAGIRARFDAAKTQNFDSSMQTYPSKKENDGIKADVRSIMGHR